MEKELDLRIQKTYLALTKSLYEMMKEMAFEDISKGIIVENYDITTLLEKVAYFVKESEENNL